MSTAPKVIPYWVHTSVDYTIDDIPEGHRDAKFADYARVKSQYKAKKHQYEQVNEQLNGIIRRCQQQPDAEECKRQQHDVEQQQEQINHELHELDIELQGIFIKYYGFEFDPKQLHSTVQATKLSTAEASAVLAYVNDLEYASRLRKSFRAIGKDRFGNPIFDDRLRAYWIMAVDLLREGFIHYTEMHSKEYPKKVVVFDDEHRLVFNENDARQTQIFMHGISHEVCLNLAVFYSANVHVAPLEVSGPFSTSTEVLVPENFAQNGYVLYLEQKPESEYFPIPIRFGYHAFEMEVLFYNPKFEVKRVVLRNFGKKRKGLYHSYNPGMFETAKKWCPGRLRNVKNKARVVNILSCYRVMYGTKDCIKQAHQWGRYNLLLDRKYNGQTYERDEERDEARIGYDNYQNDEAELFWDNNYHLNKQSDYMVNDMNQYVLKGGVNDEAYLLFAVTLFVEIAIFCCLGVLIICFIGYLLSYIFKKNNAMN